MNILKARAWCTLDKPLLKFESYVDDCGVAWFRMCQDHDVKYNFGVPFIDDDWIVEWWTGKVDKNNVDIYSGDLIKHGLFAFNDTVKFGKECWNNLPDGVDENDISTIIESPIEVLAQTSSEFRGTMGLLELEHAVDNNPDVSGVELLGNVHENPELLVVKEEGEDNV